jgi:SAM-dependent methyltransferase
MERVMNVRASYDSAADAYADHLFTELEQKPLDRHLLNRFAEAVAGRGLVADLGCGPGHVAKYLHDKGVTMLGVDISPEMIRRAKEMIPAVDFRVGDMKSLDLPDESLAGIVAFYSIVHSERSELDAVFREFRRLLANGGTILLAFHIGDTVTHVEELWGQAVDLDFRFHTPAEVVSDLRAANILVSEITERDAYADAEYPSRRCYLFGRAA